jgi:hypothetical protein
MSNSIETHENRLKNAGKFGYYIFAPPLLYALGRHILEGTQAELPEFELARNIASSALLVLAGEIVGRYKNPDGCLAQLFSTSGNLLTSLAGVIAPDNPNYALLTSSYYLSLGDASFGGPGAKILSFLGLSAAKHGAEKIVDRVTSNR